MKASSGKCTFTSSNDCAEVAALPGNSVGVRNSRNPDGPILQFTPNEWQALLGGIWCEGFDGFGSTASTGQAGVVLAENLIRAG
jgi:hypothetical protein